MSKTAHEQYAELVHNAERVHSGKWHSYNDLHVYLQQQIFDIEAERDALRAERDALKAKHDALEAKCEALQSAEWRASYSLEETRKLLAQARQTADMWRRAYHGDGAAPE